MEEYVKYFLNLLAVTIQLWIACRSDFTVVFIFTVGICTFACPKVPKDLKGEYPLDNPPGLVASDKCQLSCRTVAQLACTLCPSRVCGYRLFRLVFL